MGTEFSILSHTRSQSSDPPIPLDSSLLVSPPDPPGPPDPPDSSPSLCVFISHEAATSSLFPGSALVCLDPCLSKQQPALLQDCLSKEVAICKSFGHVEDKIYVLLQCPFVGCCWDLIFRSKLSENSQASLQLLPQEAIVLPLALKDALSASFTLPQVVLDSDVLVIAPVLSTDLFEIAGSLHDVQSLIGEIRISCHTYRDDSQALIWDISSMGQHVEGGLNPILAYTACAEIDQLSFYPVSLLLCDNTNCMLQLLLYHAKAIDKPHNSRRLLRKLSATQLFSPQRMEATKALRMKKMQELVSFMD
ncbi:unnamed protein product [Thlaspi arvense]|uniref:Uncharacterized protein n=1 Tax=Thlaspi arvense TaxID=13288 RepID=A0AAU9SAR3_THLAR|nr:unnamed protein product [Thlaspi arvense]